MNAKELHEWKMEYRGLLNDMLAKLVELPVEVSRPEPNTDHYYEVHVPTYLPHTYSAKTADELAQWLARTRGFYGHWRAGRTFRVVSVGCRELEFNYTVVLDIDTGEYHATLVKE